MLCIPSEISLFRAATCRDSTYVFLSVLTTTIFQFTSHTLELSSLTPRELGYLCFHTNQSFFLSCTFSGISPVWVNQPPASGGKLTGKEKQGWVLECCESFLKARTQEILIKGAEGYGKSTDSIRYLPNDRDVFMLLL